MKYSFVIPAYNNKFLLKNTLEALNYQKNYGRDDYEVILVDDGSDDNTFDYIKGINKNYNLKYLFLERTEESCRSKTRNYGWKNTNGEIIVFIDSDIIIKKDYLSELERCFSASEDILVIGNRLMLNEPLNFNDVVTGKIFQKYFFDSTNLDILEIRHFIYETLSYNSNCNFYSWMQVYGCNMAVSRKNLEKVDGFDENFKHWGMEDQELGYALMKAGVKIVINSKLEVLHQDHGERNDVFITEEMIPGYKKNIEYFMKKHPKAITIHKKFLFKFLIGEIPVINMNFRSEIIKIDFKDKSELENIKKQIIDISSKTKTTLIVNDYVENSDLYIWIQLLGKTESTVKYFPVSKRIDKDTILKYQKIRKERQKAKAS